MNTPFSEIYELFQYRIIRDTTFFIQNDNQTEVQRVAEVRMKQLLNQAIYNIVMSAEKKNFEVDFYNKDDLTDTFLFELLALEKQLIADLMFECYMTEDFIVRWNALKQRYFTDDEIKIVMNSPANSLREFNNSVALLKEENRKKVKTYLRRNRNDFSYKYFNWKYDEWGE